MLLLLDNHDSFTYNLADYLSQLGHAPLVKQPEAMTLTDWQYPYTGVLLSPGPGHPAQLWPKQATLSDIRPSIRPSIPTSLIEAVGYFADRGIPILGICLGHQAIGLWAGGALQERSEPVHGKVFSLVHNGLGLFGGLPARFDVVRYHSLTLDIQSLPPTIRIDAHCLARHIGAEGQQVLMAISHNNLPIWGLQYHPEAALTHYGMAVLANWLGNCSLPTVLAETEWPKMAACKL
jgi:anthranilate synthase/aminodeoxychorismate synthase-like glutamine amidotransferase